MVLVRRLQGGKFFCRRQDDVNFLVGIPECILDFPHFLPRRWSVDVHDVRDADMFPEGSVVLCGRMGVEIEDAAVTRAQEDVAGEVILHMALDDEILVGAQSFERFQRVPSSQP